LYVGAHLDKFGKVGKVKAGDTIGYVGDTGTPRAVRRTCISRFIRLAAPR